MGDLLESGTEIRPVVSERQLAGNLYDVALAAREGCELRPSVIGVADFDEAQAAANDIVSGLSSGICIRSLKYAIAFRRASAAGMVMVDLPMRGAITTCPSAAAKPPASGSESRG